jgi:hypothetical protein
MGTGGGASTCLDAVGSETIFGGKAGGCGVASPSPFSAYCKPSKTPGTPLSNSGEGRGEMLFRGCSATVPPTPSLVDPAAELTSPIETPEAFSLLFLTALSILIGLDCVLLSPILTEGGRFDAKASNLERRLAKDGASSSSAGFSAISFTQLQLRIRYASFVTCNSAANDDDDGNSVKVDPGKRQ